MELYPPICNAAPNLTAVFDSNLELVIFALIFAPEPNDYERWNEEVEGDEDVIIAGEPQRTSK